MKSKKGFVVYCMRLDFLVAEVTYVNRVMQRLVGFWPFLMKLLSRNPVPIVLFWFLLKHDVLDIHHS